MNSNLDKARYMMYKLWFNMVGSDIIKTFIIVLMILTIVAIIYFKWIYDPNDFVPVPTPLNNTQQHI